ncbi:MAG: glycoside hydrolase family 3 C-terminal domain-containing protein [Kofleriaceae bacterium]|nr:glycoside hydrolase family 3 C-terminal domain-containing protein [Kofleriaceae bacterium]
MQGEAVVHGHGRAGPGREAGGLRRRRDAGAGRGARELAGGLGLGHRARRIDRGLDLHQAGDAVLIEAGLGLLRDGAHAGADVLAVEAGLLRLAAVAAALGRLLGAARGRRQQLLDRLVAAAAAAARGADVAVVVVGESDAIARESKSRLSLDLPGHQEHLIRAIHATGTPVVVVLINGRPLSINWTARHVPAILEAWFPGENAGTAIARALFGDTNPAGRLTMTFPRSVGQLPMNFPAKVASQADGETSRVAGALFPFGHGLSYTSFAYANLAVTPARPRPGDEVTVAADITNTGPRDGDEVVQLYVRDAYASVTPYELQLRGFERIHLKRGETKTVSFKLGRRELELYNDAGEWVVEPGLFVVHVGASSADLRLQGSFYLGTTREEEIFPAKNLSFGTEVGASPRPR